MNNKMGSLKKEIDKQKKRDIRDAFWISLFFGVIFVTGGVVYDINNIVKVGISLKYLQPSVLNASMFYLLGIVFLVVSYFFYKKQKD